MHVTKKYLFITAGWLCVGVAVLGIFLPLIPTTPLLLLAAACFVRGSEKLYNWLLNHRQLGPYIRDFREGRGIPRKAKISTIAVMWTTIGISILILRLIWVKVLLFFIAAGVTVYLLSFPERE